MASAEDCDKVRGSVICWKEAEDVCEGRAIGGVKFDQQTRG